MTVRHVWVSDTTPHHHNNSDQQCVSVSLWLYVLGYATVIPVPLTTEWKSQQVTATASSYHVPDSNMESENWIVLFLSLFESWILILNSDDSNESSHAVFYSVATVLWVAGSDLQSLQSFFQWQLRLLLLYYTTICGSIQSQLPALQTS